MDERDHLALVQTLRELEADGLCAFHLAAMERMSLRDQIELASRSTVSELTAKCLSYLEISYSRY